MASGRKMPLGGIRILEAGHAWAAPHCTELLSDLGAEVIKVEAPSGDMLRSRGLRDGTFLGGKAGKDPWNRAAAFHEVNRNKLSISLDLDGKEGKDLFMELVKKSDAVVSNYTVKVIEKLGLTYKELKAVKSDIILVTLNAYGMEGPWHEYRTYGVVIEPMCGFFSLTGYLDGDRPMRSGVDHIDPLSGAHAAGALVAALFHRQRTGEGQHANLSFLESAVNFIGPEILEYTVNSRIRSLISSEIKVPDDVLLYSFMVKYSDDKKLFLKDKHIFYILQRVERSFEAIINIIDKIDLYSLKNKKKVTYKSIRYVLAVFYIAQPVSGDDFKRMGKIRLYFPR